MPDRTLVFGAEDIAKMCFDFHHPLEEKADISMVPLVHAAGPDTVSVTLAYLEPNKASFPKHRHHLGNEWIYVVKGNATLEMDDVTHPLAPGSFAAFPAGDPAHKLVNTGTERLQYLMGGDQIQVDFTEVGLRMTRTDTCPDMNAEMATADQFVSIDFMARMKTND